MDLNALADATRELRGAGLRRAAGRPRRCAHAVGSRRRADTRRRRGARAPWRRRLRPRRPHGHRGRGHVGPRARRSARGGVPGVRARSTLRRRDGRRGARRRALRSPPAPIRPVAGSRVGGAFRHRGRTPGEGRRSHGQERQRLRHPTVARWFVRHDRRARAGDPPLPAATPRSSSGARPTPTRSRSGAAPTGRRASSGTACAPISSSKVWPPTSSASDRRRVPQPVAGAPPFPDGPHRGRISIRPAGVRDLAPALGDSGVAVARRGRSGHRPCRGRHPGRAGGRTRRRGGSRRLAAPGSGRSRPRRFRTSAAEPRDHAAHPLGVRSERQAQPGQAAARTSISRRC